MNGQPARRLHLILATLTVLDPPESTIVTACRLDHITALVGFLDRVAERMQPRNSIAFNRWPVQSSLHHHEQDVAAKVASLSASRLSRKHTVPYHAYAKRDVSCCDYPNWFAAHNASRPAMSTVPVDVFLSKSLSCHLLIDSQLLKLPL
jgi:hypothetical protein